MFHHHNGTYLLSRRVSPVISRYHITLRGDRRINVWSILSPLIGLQDIDNILTTDDTRMWQTDGRTDRIPISSLRRQLIRDTDSARRVRWPILPRPSNPVYFSIPSFPLQPVPSPCPSLVEDPDISSSWEKNSISEGTFMFILVHSTVLKNSSAADVKNKL